MPLIHWRVIWYKLQSQPLPSWTESKNSAFDIGSEWFFSFLSFPLSVSHWQSFSHPQQPQINAIATRLNFVSACFVSLFIVKVSDCRRRHHRRYAHSFLLASKRGPPWAVVGDSKKDGNLARLFQFRDCHDFSNEAKLLSLLYNCCTEQCHYPVSGSFLLFNSVRHLERMCSSVTIYNLWVSDHHHQEHYHYHHHHLRTAV